MDTPLDMDDIITKLKYLEKIKMQNRVRANRFYKINKNRIKEKYKAKQLISNHKTFDCNCGGKYQYRNRKIHFNTKKHLGFYINSGAQ